MPKKKKRKPTKTIRDEFGGRELTIAERMRILRGRKKKK